LTQIEGAVAEDLQGDGSKIDDERGATTGRPRDVGILDAVVARYSCLVNGATNVTLTKLDKV
jgi:adenylosuccinate synthase